MPGSMDTQPTIISGTEMLDVFVRAAAEAPHAAALFCDIDGTISPIAPRPSEAGVSDSFRDLLARLVERIGLVAFVTGRLVEDGRRMIPLQGAVHVGAHGLETMAADGSVVEEPDAEPYVPIVHDLAEAAARDLDCRALGIVIEDKRSVLALHYRLAPDPEAARVAILTRVAAPATARGLTVASGHFVIELRPPLSYSKGTAVRRLLAAGDYTSAVCCGDDLTDVTAFMAVREWGGSDARRRTLAVAAITDETPQLVLDAADVLVRATPGVHEVLRRLAAAVGA